MSSILRKLTKRNEFNLSEGNGLSLRIGDLVPTYVRHLNPGDTFDVSAYYAGRLMPMQAPIMTQLDIKSWAFAIPYRLVWDDYEQFFTGKNKMGDEVTPVFPRANYSRVTQGEIDGIMDRSRLGSLADYLDLVHTDTVSDEEVEKEEQFINDLYRMPEYSMLEPRAYQMIFNEWFRDQNIDNPVEFGTDSYIYDFSSTRASNEWANLMTIRRKRWEKDYFTSALPTPSMSDDIAIPLDASIVAEEISGDPGLMRSVHGDSFVNSSDTLSVSNFDGSPHVQKTTVFNGGGNSTDVYYDPNGTLRTGANEATIRELTYARMIYQYLLDVARGGSVRYKDFVKTLFNVNVPDYRAEIPEYIGGGSQPFVISEVLQTSETNDTPQGNLSGRGTSVGGAHKYYYKAKEHTIIMVITCVMPKPSYSSGLPKRHFKFDKFDYYLPQFDHVGDQEIKRKELSYLDPDVNEETFGYIERYAEDKSSVSRVHGVLRGPLSYWTMARSFDNRTPMLSSEFLQASDSLIDRPFFVQKDGRYEPEHVILECGFRVNAWRPMSKNSRPIV